MKRLTMITIAAMTLLVAGDLMAQSRVITKRTVNTRALKTKGISVKGSPRAFNASRQKLRALSAASVQKSKSVSSLNGKALDSNLKGLLAKFDGIDGESRKQLNMLRGGPNSGKSKQAVTLILQIQRHVKVAKANVRAAKKANMARDAKAVQRSLNTANTHAKGIDKLSGKLGLLEPIISR